ncbi:P-II family nitrogen regulator [Kangiella sp.]|uniref:P-II family nitrogen regulator n=1 Tax=Kangiella sp. TaxID=1920245 RepID=UPI0019976EEF|nr:P-II family nitrogen regulator [Kangiella sp.]MBD3653926.1 P-II family nitrogen regulator [Kangiella sp.]
MKIQKVTAIFDEFRLKDVEDALIKHGVRGFTLHPVRGRGRFFDSFNENHLIKHIQMEVYARSEQANDIAQVVVEAAHVNADSEGLVCIVPVNDLFWIHDKCSATDGDFKFHQ